MLRLFKSRGSTYTTSKSTVPGVGKREVPGAERLQLFKENPSKISRSQIEAASEHGRGFSSVSVSLSFSQFQFLNSLDACAFNPLAWADSDSGLHEMSMYTNRKPVLCHDSRTEIN